MKFLVQANGFMILAGEAVRCALGRGGVCDADAKREGDGRTPAGDWPLRRLLWRPDRVARPDTRLPSAPIEPRDGWCDDPRDPCYNRPVSLPHGANAETLWREDHLYDLLVVLGHNDHPVIPGAGSAIFLHLAKPDYGPTEGCIALSGADFTRLLGMVEPGDAIRVAASPPGAQA